MTRPRPITRPPVAWIVDDCCRIGCPKCDPATREKEAAK